MSKKNPTVGELVVMLLAISVLLAVVRDCGAVTP
jgi:hypothetical protein